MIKKVIGIYIDLQRINTIFLDKYCLFFLVGQTNNCSIVVPKYLSREILLQQWHLSFKRALTRNYALVSIF